ncbi:MULTISPECIES: thiolase family protein [Rhodococcus]|uniref:Thiolase family protein n=1 Tax=Rhodococcus oxybenzonivorans TaxID=1990687 RepID=A0AAE4V537_9NOCA|nr:MULTISPECIES: thiolase family protein [Rhodococcus]MDV7241541.1 thiolase family protein [Rhodococcus oxybenzonivorans]MDV7268023.1 thiolase family protein [Rhodococcus oxybenzonivorans]MDV7273926.1 thiolase family protein [Rhodococcus oxybenzonivorans]MDV7333822.1 thiolase family protein [Rhodococcus oxybenzonivorans]MDV7343241.1 thiolase family protein [Rhodococcus oxybenzonivorans]
MAEKRNPFQRSAREVIIAEAARTPMGKSHPERGWFRDTHPNDMLGAVYTDLIRRSGLDPAVVEDLVIGCTAPFGEQSRNIGRNAWLQVGYPPEVPAVVLDRRCGSAQTAVEMGAALVGSGTHDVVLAGGVEHMGHVPITSPAKISELYGDPWPEALRERYDFVHQGESAELIADRWGISRQDMDEFAVRSHRLATEAIEAGRFDAEMIPLDLAGETRATDQTVRPGTTLDSLAGLKTAFRKDGRITAGSSSPISDGASGVLLASREAVDTHALRARARILDQTTVGVDPIIMLTGPIPATQKLLDRNGMSINDIDLFEVNEAFSSVVLAWERELKPDMDRVNVNGGAIALGHPVGATGARLIATIVAELERRDAEIGLVTMCCGGGLGTATLIQRID